tara:strand:- start:138 stop:299 length:162 start_codon:yes stop_codon:yes gene_type:complete
MRGVRHLLVIHLEYGVMPDTATTGLEPRPSGYPRGVVGLELDAGAGTRGGFEA